MDGRFVVVEACSGITQSATYISPSLVTPISRPSLGTLAESVERRPRMSEIGNLVPSRVKPVTYKIYTCHFLAWCSALIG